MMARTLVSLLLAVALAAPGPSLRFDKRISKEKEALHALNRLTFGPRPGDVEAVAKIGVKKWIDAQLNPGGMAQNPILEARLKPLASLSMSQEEIAENYPSRQLIRAFVAGRLPLPDDPKQRAVVNRLIERFDNRKNADSKSQTDPKQLRRATPDERADMLENMPKENADKTTAARPAASRRFLANASPERRREILSQSAPQLLLAYDLLEQKLYRAVYTNRQLEEVLTDFWFNHFNVFLDKGADRQFVTSYERDAIRPHVLGKFKDLLVATAQHPAMLFYLDNWQSVAENTATRGRRTRGLNENYARELLELHTLGVDGGYSQKDVTEVARCFTGWTIAEPYRRARFDFNSRVHDDTGKTVLGVRIPAGGGKEDGLKVLDMVAHHPSTARFISTKLAQRFVADNPPEALIKTMAETFRKSDGDIKAVMRTMLHSREFWSEGAHRSKVKSPFEMVASSLRATGADVTFAFGVANRIADLGQPLYRKQEPTGYPNKGSEWVNSAALLGRMNFALDLVQNKVPGVKVDITTLEGDPQEVAKRLLSSDASPQTQSAIEKSLAEKKDSSVIAGLVLGSPEFQRR